MRADEPDMDNSIRVVDPNNDPILVASDIEHHPAILYARTRTGAAPIAIRVQLFGVTRSDNLSIADRNASRTLFPSGGPAIWAVVPTKL